LSWSVWFARRQHAHPNTPRLTSRFTFGHQNRVITRWYVLFALLWPAIGEAWQAARITLRSLGGTSFTRS
jgi:hypothetical protein